jgi:hypothetical protein
MQRTDAPFAVLGFRPHTYWTAVVALTGPADDPRVIERRRVVFAAGDERGVYHQAAETPIVEAPALLAKVRAATLANTVRELSALVADLQSDGLAIRAAVVPSGTARLPEDLGEILRVHSRQHAAEGNFYRDVVAAACESMGLAVRRVVERDLPELTSDRLGLDRASLDERMKALGASLGPPWGEDYRLATEAAWLQLGDEE